MWLWKMVNGEICCGSGREAVRPWWVDWGQWPFWLRRACIQRGAWDVCLGRKHYQLSTGPCHQVVAHSLIVYPCTLLAHAHEAKWQMWIVMLDISSSSYHVDYFSVPQIASEFPHDQREVLLAHLSNDTTAFDVHARILNWGRTCAVTELCRGNLFSQTVRDIARGSKTKF